jgi:dynein heavy chain
MLQAQAWVPWLDTVPEFKCDPSRPFSQIIVPTADTVRYTYVVDALLAAGKHVLCVGETGTGKTLTLMTKLLEGMPQEVQPVFMTFSARTSANQTQDIIGESWCPLLTVAQVCRVRPKSARNVCSSAADAL